MNAAIDRVDSQLANLYSQLAEHGLLGCVDIVVVSDHGMTSIRFVCAEIGTIDQARLLGLWLSYYRQYRVWRPAGTRQATLHFFSNEHSQCAQVCF